MSSISIAPTYSGVNLAERPSRRRRAGALLIDACIHNAAFLVSFVVVYLPLAIVYYLITGRDPEFNRFSESVAGNLLAYAVSLFLAFTYLIAFETIYGATPGKWLLGMHVFKSDGRRCDARAAAIRALCLFFIDGLLYGLVAYLSMQPPLYQRVGDRIAKTVVVKRRESPSPPPPFWRFLVAAVIYLIITKVAVFIVVLAWTI
ncbi:MAG: RDD family protein [Roseiflexus sp.]|jgi:uncharacterized RDD family membrane protein YckC|uniref:RDD family protein n=1 Tax=Roseiflexus sp. TaxID=2562120 RepID=UPI0025F4D900|nr:RDD family protein [Roseiflexus sp.]MCL6542883.1 RDD family protein [Roseiflexus sp.]